MAAGRIRPDRQTVVGATPDGRSGGDVSLDAALELIRGGARAVVLLVAGSRPECIKLAPVARALGRSELLTPVVLNSGQQPEVVRSAFAEFGVPRTVDLDAMPAFTHLQPTCDHLEHEIRAALRRIQPAAVVVAGNTPTSYAAARAGHAEGLSVAHIEAGLRTDNSMTPFPEEWLRREITHYAQMHFASCRSAVSNLVGDGVDLHSIYHVGSTGIDTLARTLRDADVPTGRDEPRSTLLVTLHRSENYDRGAELLCESLIQLCRLHPRLHVLFPLHANPRIIAPVRRRLRWLERCEITGTMPYRDFITAARTAALIISDSGSIQEEAPHLGVPMVVPRINTERPEALATGWVELADLRRGNLVSVATQALAKTRGPALPIDAEAPFGAGNAGARIVRILERRSGVQRSA